MKAYILLGLTLSVATGCSSSYYVSNEPAPDKCSFAQMNENAKDQSSTIVTMQGEEIQATDLFVGGDSTTFLQLTSPKRRTIATSSVKIIRIDNVRTGAVDGLIRGALVGGGVGLLFQALATALGQPGSVLNTLGNVGGPIAGGALLGAGVGAIVRHTDRYFFQTQSDDSQKGK